MKSRWGLTHVSLVWPHPLAKTSVCAPTKRTFRVSHVLNLYVAPRYVDCNYFVLRRILRHKRFATECQFVISIVFRTSKHDNEPRLNLWCLQKKDLKLSHHKLPIATALTFQASSDKRSGFWTIIAIILLSFKFFTLLARPLLIVKPENLGNAESRNSRLRV